MRVCALRCVLLALLSGARPVAAQAADVIFPDSFENSCLLDADSDRLPDCVETGTGRFAHGADTGSKPDDPDTDDDGIRDGDEVLGTAGGLNLPAFGVSPVHKDLLVEYDWLDDANGCAAHSHRPPAIVIEQLRGVFARAPVPNPDGSTGINLIQDYGQGGVFTGGNRVDGIADGFVPGFVDHATFQGVKSTHFRSSRLGYFHYGLVAHRYNRSDSHSSGHAEVAGDDLMVTPECNVGLPATDALLRNTIMHELGHNLGLLHGGNEACNHKPNYNSVMNYRYQFRGTDDTCEARGSADFLDPLSANYSSGVRLALNENTLDERQGVCGHLGAGTTPIDWNRNGLTDATTAANINPYADEFLECVPMLRILNDWDDWGHIQLTGLPGAPDAGAQNPMTVTCQDLPRTN